MKDHKFIGVILIASWAIVGAMVSVLATKKAVTQPCNPADAWLCGIVREAGR